LKKKKSNRHQKDKKPNEIDEISVKNAKEYGKI